MNWIGGVIGALVFLVFSLGLIALGMQIERNHNKQMWRKYYEGRGEKAVRA